MSKADDTLIRSTHSLSSGETVERMPTEFAPSPRHSLPAAAPPLQDGYLLGWRLAMASAAARGGGRVTEGLLESYGAERLPAWRALIRFADALKRLAGNARPGLMDRAVRLLWAALPEASQAGARATPAPRLLCARAAPSLLPRWARPVSALCPFCVRALSALSALLRPAPRLPPSAPPLPRRPALLAARAFAVALIAALLSAPIAAVCSLRSCIRVVQEPRPTSCYYPCCPLLPRLSEVSGPEPARAQELLLQLSAGGGLSARRLRRRGSSGAGAAAAQQLGYRGVAGRRTTAMHAV